MKPGLISIVVPTYDSAPYLRALYDSVVGGALRTLVGEFIFVCEGHGDNTDEVLAEIARQSAVPVRIHRPTERLGKFRSRYEGAKLASHERVLLIDSRVKLLERTARVIQEMPFEYRIVQGHLHIDETKNIFCRYWLRTHARIFHRNFEQQDRIIEVRPENFHEYATGTTILLVDRELFVKTCERLAGAPMYSDDTYLLKEMTRETPLIIHPGFWIEWEPRREWWKFLKHLYDRGPGFAEYHVYERRGWLFYLVAAGFLGLLAVGVLAAFDPVKAGLVLLGGIAALALSTAFFAKSFKEFVMLAPLHTLSLIAYGLGALRGTWVVYRSRKAKPTDSKLQSEGA